MKKTYTKDFELHDFAAPPKKIELSCSDSRIKASYQPVEAAKGKFRVSISNLTGGGVTPTGKYPIQLSVHITAENEKEFAEEYIIIDLYPEGIFVTIDDRLAEDGFFSFYTCKGESADYLRPVLLPTEFFVRAAYRLPDGDVCVTHKGIKVSEKLTPQDKLSSDVESRFRYKITSQAEGRYLFEPNAVIPHFESDRFLYKLNMSYSGEGGNYEYALPVRLVGDTDRLEDKHARDVEKEKLRRILEIVGLSANGRARELIRKWDSIPTSELRIVRQAVYDEGREYYINEGKEWLDQAAWAERRIAFWATVRWLDNMAFSVYIRYVAGPKFGDLAEAIATPLYDTFLDMMGVRLNDYIWENEQKPFDTQYYKRVVFQMAENSAWALLTDGFSDGNMDLKKKGKKIGSFIAAATLLSFIRHYCLDPDDPGYGDFYISLKNAVYDTGINSIKALFIYALVGKLWRNAVKLSPAAEHWLSRLISADTLARLSKLEASDAASRAAEGVAYMLGDTVAEMYVQLTSSDPEGDSKLRTTFHVTDENGISHEISLTEGMCLVVRDLCSTLGLDSLFAEEKVRNTANSLPTEQPYVNEKEVEESLSKIGMAPQ